MKTVFNAAFLLLSLFTFAQNDLPKIPTDINPLLVGEKIPNLELYDSSGELVSLEQLFAKQKTILIFYRGGWCPYCNVHLGALAEAESTLLDLGYQIVAVSPDSPKNLRETSEKDKVEYLLLSDSKATLSKAVGLAFQAPENYNKYLVKGSEGVNSSIIPVPTLMILNTKGEILFEHINPNYTERITTELVLAVAKALK
jgi:peroxiredoxin